MMMNRMFQTLIVVASIGLSVFSIPVFSAPSVRQAQVTTEDMQPFAILNSGHQLIITDRSHEALLSLDKKTGVRRILYQPKNSSKNASLVLPASIAKLNEQEWLVEDLATGLVKINCKTDSQHLIVSAEGKVGFLLHDYFIVFMNNKQPALLLQNIRTKKWQLLIDPAKNAPRINEPIDVAQMGHHLYIVDGALREVVRIDMETGIRKIVTGGGIGKGPIIQDPFSVIANVVDGQLYLTEGRMQRVLSINPITGDRAIASDNQHGSGPHLLAPFDIETDGQTMYVSDIGRMAVFAIDIKTGNRHFLYQNPHYNQPILISDNGVSMLDKNTVIMGNERIGTIIAENIDTGKRWILSGPTHGKGPILVSISSCDKVKNNIVATDSFPGRLFLVDPITGDRTLVSSARKGTGPMMPMLPTIYVPKNSDTIFLGAQLLGNITSVNMQLGDRKIISSDKKGSGPNFVYFRGITQGLSDELVVPAVNLGALMAVKIKNGDRYILSGTGIPLKHPTFARTLKNNHIVLSDASYPALIDVDLHTGNRTLLSGIQKGKGPLFQKPGGIALIDQTHAIVVDMTGPKKQTALFKVNLETGDRCIVPCHTSSL